MSRPLPSPATGLPRCSNHHAYVPCPLPRRIGTGACVDCFPIPRGLPQNSGWVGIRIVLFEACSGFTRVTARTLAQPPKAAFVTGLRRDQLPGHAARQLPAQSTTRWVEPSSTGVSRLRGAPEFADIGRAADSLPLEHGVWPALPQRAEVRVSKRLAPIPRTSADQAGKISEPPSVVLATGVKVRLQLCSKMTYTKKII